MINESTGPIVAELSNIITDYAREEGVTMEMLDTAIELVKGTYYTDALIKGCVDNDEVDRLVKDIRKRAIAEYGAGIVI